VAWFKKSSSAGPVVAEQANEHAADQPTVQPIEQPIEQPLEHADQGGQSAAIDALTDAEVDWVRSTIAELTEQGVRADDIDDLGRHYDELLSAWLRLSEDDRPDPHEVVNRIGLAFGQYVADHAGLDWGVATEPPGPEIALHRPREQREVLLYPREIVGGKWATQETGILPALARATVDAIDRARGSADAEAQPSAADGSMGG
jgi:hypothetical protein